MSHHVLQMTDGTIAIMHTIARPDGNEPTADECIAKWHPDRRAAVQSHTPVDLAAIPADRTFRNAWRHDGAAFLVDMDHARAIHRDRMRAARAPLLAALDVAYDKTDERGDAAAKTEVAAAKQALRDVTADPAIAAAATSTDLAAVWPAILGSPPAA